MRSSITGFMSRVAAGICFLLPSFVLQSCGLFLPFWISVNATSECQRGIFYNRRCTADTKGLGTLVIGLQTTSFVLIVISTLSLMWSMCRYRKRDDNDHRMGSNDRVGCSCKCLSGCLICFYPIAGLIGIAGCVVVMVHYEDFVRGWAFYLSFAASCCVIFQGAVGCCAIYATLKARKLKNLAEEDSNKRQTTVAALVAVGLL